MRRWVEERQPVRELAKKDVILAEQPYVDERWLSLHLLRSRTRRARGAPGGGHRPARDGPSPAGLVRLMLGASPASIAYKPGWYFYALGPQMVICLYLGYLTARKTSGDLLNWLIAAFSSLVPLAGILIMLGLWWRAGSNFRPTPALPGSTPKLTGPTPGRGEPTRRAGGVTEAAWVFCGRARLPLPRADAFEPPGTAHVDRRPRRGRGAALGEAVEAPRLRQLVRGARTVAVAIPDASRPCPSAVILEGVLQQLAEAGVGRKTVSPLSSAAACIARLRPQSGAARGRPVARRVTIEDAQGLESPIADLGVTSRGAPVHVARRVADADLAVTVGVVEPHLYAGFSGGVKGGRHRLCRSRDDRLDAPPGVHRHGGGDPREARRQPVPRDPARDRRAHPAGVGRQRGGGRARDRGRGGRRADRSAGPARPGAERWMRTINRSFDVIVAGIMPQRVRASTRPAAPPRTSASRLCPLSPTAACWCSAPTCDSAGNRPGGPELRRRAVRRRLGVASVARGLREPLGPGGQRCLVVARVLERFRIAVVGAVDPSFLAPLERLGVAACDSVDAALAAEDARLGRRARVLAVADALSTVVRGA